MEILLNCFFTESKNEIKQEAAIIAERWVRLLKLSHLPMSSSED